jgi:hypothetical protein
MRRDVWQQFLYRWRRTVFASKPLNRNSLTALGTFDSIDSPCSPSKLLANVRKMIMYNWHDLIRVGLSFSNVHARLLGVLLDFCIIRKWLPCLYPESLYYKNLRQECQILSSRVVLNCFQVCRIRIRKSETKIRLCLIQQQWVLSFERAHLLGCIKCYLSVLLLKILLLIWVFILFYSFVYFRLLQYTSVLAPNSQRINVDIDWI